MCAVGGNKRSCCTSGQGTEGAVEMAPICDVRRMCFESTPISILNRSI